MPQTNSKKILPIVGAILVLIVVGYLAFYLLSKRSLGPSQPVVEQKPTEQLAPGNISVEELKKIEVPEPGEQEKVSENVAVPKESLQAGPNTDAKLRIFDLKGEKGVLTPSEFRSYKGDIVHMKFTAVDQDYDFFLEGYNVKLTAKKGEEKIIEFQTTGEGIYNFYCSLCKTKDQPAGKIVVVPR